MNRDKIKKSVIVIYVLHFFEALAAYSTAKKKGKNPVLYFCLTWAIGFPILVPLLRSKAKEA